MSLIKPLKGVPLFLLTTFLLLAGMFVWLQHTAKPWRKGRHPLPGLGAEVSVRWDVWGVPHVTAGDELDLMRALGWLHANDRMTQMELGRRAGRGRLAEVAGPTALGTDVYLRTLRIEPTAEAIYRSLPDRSRAWLDAYAEGVNAWLTARGGSLAPGMRILGRAPEPWRSTDSLLFTLLMSVDLSFWDQHPEEERFQWLRAFGEAGVRDLVGDPEIHLPEAILALAEGREPPESTGQQDEEGADQGEVVADEPVALGSNNWAVGPSRAAGGKAMLANDPHLGLNLPSVWYQAQLRSPEYDAAGMTLPGVPGVVIGRGPHLAWALTNVMLDDHDIVFERLDETGRRYWRDGAWRDLEVEEHRIQVRGEDDVPLTLRRTDLGPLLEADPERGLPPRSLRWTAHVADDALGAFQRLAMASTPEEALDAMGTYVAPAQNLVAAFASGEILYTTLGQVPDRKKGGGRLPIPGWDPDYGWNGLRPQAANPVVESPPDDLLVTANSDIFPPNESERFTADFFLPFRHDRIHQRLAEATDWTVDGFSELLTDNHSLFADRVVAALAGYAPFEGDAGRAFAALEDWDRNMDPSGPSALFALLRRQLMADLFGDEQRAAELPKPLGHRRSLVDLLEGRAGSRWFDDVSTPEVETPTEILTAALATAWTEGQRRWGPAVSQWRYGELLTLTLRHRLDSVPVFGRWSRRGPFSVAGSPTTVLALGGAWIDDGERMTVTFGPSMRWIVDWSDPETAWAVLPGGQSGHPADPHYDDQIPLFLAGRLHEAPWSEAAIEAATVARSTLVP
ncbi:MAG: penicillin acylase family protein [Acidobacteriota bacterium]